MDLILRTFQEDGTTPANSTFTVDYFQNGVLQSFSDTGVDNIALSDVDDGSEVTLVIDSTGRHPYSKKFKVYFIDLDLSIKLPTIITDILNPNYNNPYPFFFYILNPCTYQVDVYDASSSPYGSATWYLNNELADTAGGNRTFTFTSPGFYQLKRRVVVEDTVNGGLLWDRYYSSGPVALGLTTNTVEENLALDTQYNVQYEEIIPEIDIKVTAPADILNGVIYYNRLETVTIETLVTPTSPYNDPSLLTLEYEIIDPSGNRITPSVQSINIATPPVDTSTEFTMEKRGDYTVRSLVTDSCRTHVHEVIIPAYNFVQFIPIQESLYEVYNASNFTSITYNVSYLTDTAFVPYQEEQELPSKERQELVLGKQGIYQITVKFTDLEGEDREEVTILHYYGELKDCLTNHTMNILCSSDACGCDVPSSITYLQEMYTLSQTYFMYLQEEYGFNNIYTALDNAKIAELADIDVLLRKLEKYCKAVSCHDNKPCNCGVCASCVNGTATTLQIISGRTSLNSSITDCASGVSPNSGGCSSCG